MYVKTTSAYMIVSQPCPCAYTALQVFINRQDYYTLYNWTYATNCFNQFLRLIKFNQGSYILRSR